MTTDDDVRARARATLGALTSSGVPAPPFDTLSRRMIKAGRSRWPVVGALAVAAVVAVAVGVAVVAGRNGSGRNGGGSSSADCADAVRLDGRFYFDEYENRDAIRPEQLGPVLAVVDAPLVCDDQGGDAELPGTGVLASTLPVGTELHAMPGEASESVIAAVDSGVVRVFRAYGGDPLAFTGQVVKVRIGSGSETTFATIDDADMIRVLLDEARAQPVGGIDGMAFDYQIVLERADGLLTSLGYDIDDNRLGGRSVGAAWRDAVLAALAASPDQPTVDGYGLVSGGGTAALHAAGGCRHDRPDLTVAPQTELGLQLPPGVQFAGFFVSDHRPSAGDDAIEPFYRNSSPSITLPEFSGTLVLEVSVFLANGDTVNLCAAVRAED